MCNYKDSCPFDAAYKFGGASLNPHIPKTITSLEDPTISENVQWDYKINQTFEITIMETAQLWNLQTFEIPRKYFYDPEREQDRKTHEER